MKESMDVEDQMVLLPLLRAFHGWDQKDLALHAGLSPSTIRRWEKGLPMRRRNYEQIVATTGIPLALVETYLLPAIKAGRASLAALGSLPRSGLATADLETLTDARRAAISGLIEELEFKSPLTKIPDDTWEARTWRFVEGLCHESEAVASGDAERALKLSEVALRYAERVPGKGERRMKLEGYTWIFVGNGLRVRGLLPRSEEAFARAENAWKSWNGPTPIQLASWRLPDRKASLRRHQGRFKEALELHERALTLAQPEVAFRIMLNKAFTLEQAGKLSEALSTLQEAEKRIDSVWEPRLRCVLEFNRVVILCRLERFREAAERLPVVKSMAQGSANTLDQIRVIWLQAKISAGFGRRAEAAEFLDWVRREFVGREIVYDAALATLELAVLYMEEGRSTEVRRITAELARIFVAQRTMRETLVCVELFIKAVQHDTVTAELARAWMNELSLHRGTS